MMTNLTAVSRRYTSELSLFANFFVGLAP